MQLLKRSELKNPGVTSIEEFTAKSGKLMVHGNYGDNL
jgi:hypothetical protein